MQNSKTKNALWGLGVVIAILAVLMVLSWPKNDAASKPANSGSSGAGVLTALEERFDFGRISMAAGPVEHEFVVKNSGKEPITITKLYTSCMCTQARLAGGGKKVGPFGMPGHSGIPSISVVLAPGEEGIVTAIFDPAAHGPAGVGTIDRIVSLENNGGQTLELEFKAVVTP